MKILKTLALALNLAFTAESSNMDDVHNQRQMKSLLVWDFDHTVINVDSDEFLPVIFMGAEKAQNEFKEALSKLDFTSTMSLILGKVFSEHGKEAVLAKAASFPYLTDVRGAIEDAANLGVDQLILSDGNTVSIGAFLDGTQIRSHFNKGVIANVGQFDGEGRFSVSPAQPEGHPCSTCNSNLCKTAALDEFLKQYDARPKIGYVGDGANDGCPCLKALQVGDVFFARVGHRRQDAFLRSGPETDPEAESNQLGAEFGILKALKRAKETEGLVPKCEVRTWSTGAELRAKMADFLARQ